MKKSQPPVSLVLNSNRISVFLVHIEPKNEVRFTSPALQPHPQKIQTLRRHRPRDRQPVVFLKLP